MVNQGHERFDAAHDYIAQDYPKAAQEFFRYAVVSVDQLLEFPQLGRAGRVHGTRELVLVKYPYVFPYRAKGQEIQILNVFHSSRIWPSSFSDAV